MKTPHAHMAQQIKTLLSDRFNPTFIEVIDESSAHAGHAEAVAHPDSGHFKLKIICNEFKGKTPVQRHRMIYECLGDLMKSIHALAIDARASE